MERDIIMMCNKLPVILAMWFFSVAGSQRNKVKSSDPDTRSSFETLFIKS